MLDSSWLKRSCVRQDAPRHVTDGTLRGQSVRPEPSAAHTSEAHSADTLLSVVLAGTDSMHSSWNTAGPHWPQQLLLQTYSTSAHCYLWPGSALAAACLCTFTGWHTAAHS